MRQTHKAGHGPEWKLVADELGYVGGRTHDGEVAARARRRIVMRDGLIVSADPAGAQR